MRIGILGGTFDPVHYGHLRLAEGALQKVPLDQVTWVLTPLPPHKLLEGKVSAEDRARMVELAIQGNRSFHLSRVELDRPPPYYTVETVGLLKRQSKDPQAEWFLLVGSDDAQALPTWRNHQQLLDEVQCIVIPRPGYSTASLPEPVTVIRIDTPDISSSEVRRRIQEGRPIQGLVPEPVQRYIEEEGLYR